MCGYRILFVNEKGERDSVEYLDVDKFLPLDPTDLDSLIETFFKLANPNCTIIEISNFVFKEIIN